MYFRFNTSTNNNNNAIGLAKFATFAKGQAKARAEELHKLSGLKGHQTRIRFAPSPTGSLHIGGARTALFNWLYARKTNGKFIIRIEDTDESRSTKESEESILNDLRWLGLHWDEGPASNDNNNKDNIQGVGKDGSSIESLGRFGPYRQSERKAIYTQVAERLIKEGKAYRCFCTEEELEAKKLQMEKAGVIEPKYDGTWRDADSFESQRRLERGDPYTVRFKLPKGDKLVSFVDLVRENVSWDANAVLGDFILLRSSGVPVYNFCVAVDDAMMEISHVIRAEEHLSNTLRQLLILEALGCTPPTYAHCSLILGEDRSKLSKRHGASSVSQFKNMGFLPDAMLNYLTNLGFNDGTTKEIYEPKELINSFDITRIVKGAAVFDMEKLKWVNGQHIRRRSVESLRSLVLSAMKEPDTSDISSNSNSSSDISKVAILDKDFEFNPNSKKFIDSAVEICRRDMELISQCPRLISNVLQFYFLQELETNEVARDIFKSDTFKPMVSAILRDYFINKSFPGVKKAADETPFSLTALQSVGLDPDALQSVGLDPEEWKAYVKALSAELGIKGKDFFRPFRLALTGKTQGPEIFDQLHMISCIHPCCCVSNKMISDTNNSNKMNSDTNNGVSFNDGRIRLSSEYNSYFSLEHRMETLKQLMN